MEQPWGCLYVSFVVAEIVMQHAKKRTLATCLQTIPLWLRHVDHNLSAFQTGEIDAFRDSFYEQNPSIHFTKQLEEKMENFIF